MSQLRPNSKLPLGILGGGQLARMLALKAHEMGVPVAVLSESKDDPAAQVTALWRKGSLSDPKTLRDFLASCSVATFESEFLDADLLGKLSKETKTQIFPRPKDMAVVQDRLTQKKLIEANGLPTAAWIRVDDEKSAREAFRSLGRVVMKKRRFGYDGYGTFMVRNEAELEKFLPEIANNPHGFIGEKFIPFERELAVMVARGRKGETLHLPYVETFQENSRCLWVKGPLKQTPQLSRLAKSLEKMLEKVGYVGIMGVELFDSAEGLLVNELAPRVHNSGHYSLDALSEDQFSIHLRAVLGLELRAPVPLSGGFAMLNLLGSYDKEPSWRLPPDVRLHWYGKKENRKGRKMGHVNALGPSPEKALALVLKRRGEFRV